MKHKCKYRTSAAFMFAASLLAVFLYPVSAHSAESVRGLEQKESYTSDFARSFLSKFLYGPRQILNGALYAGGKNADYFSDPEVIEKIEDILYVYKRELAWFPVTYYTTGFRPTYGGGLYYKHKQIDALFTGMIHDSHEWSLRFKTTYRKAIGEAVWESSFSGLLEEKDDQRFYGIGASPQNDSRNAFLSGDDYGVFREDRKKLQWSSSFNPKKYWGVKYLGFYQRRGFESEGRGNQDLRDIFLLSKIPGFFSSAPISEIYNEISIHADTRDHKKTFSPGLHAETYAGFSNGLNRNKSDLFRTGFDAAAFIPTVKKDRLLVPRVIFDAVGSLDGETIPFTEYPRQHTFRGVSEKDLIRSDRVSVVPSLEYQWPLSHIFAGHMFVDYLAVGSSVGTIEWDDGIWATGAGLDFHYQKRQIAKIELAGGSEGFQATFTIGVPLRSNDPGSW